jgi:hypothetical protein
MSMRLLPSARVVLFGLLPFSFCAAGVGQFAHISRARSSALRLKSLLPEALFPFCAGVPAIGVGHILAAPPNVVPPVCFGVGFSDV